MPRTITLIHGGALGDLALAVGFVIRAGIANSTDHLRLISRASLGDLASCRPTIEPVSAEGVALHLLFVDKADLADSAREEALSRLAGQVRDTIVVCMLTGRDATPHRRLEQLGAERVISIDPRPTGERRHITAQWESAFRAQSSHAVSQCVAERRARGLRADPALQETGVERYSKIGFAQPPILIHPGSGGGSKCWPGACFQRVASDLSDRMPKTPIAFLIGPVELETWAPEGIAAFEAIAPIFLCDDPAELAHLLAATPLLIGNDSGPSHLAALLGTPTLTLFGATDAVVWRPFGLRAETIAGDAQMGPHWGLAPDVVVEHATRIING